MLPFVGHTQAVRCVAFTPDGGTLVSGGDDGNVVVWDRDAGRPRFTLATGLPSVRSVACHPDGERLLSGFRYQTGRRAKPDRLRFWSVGTGQPAAVAGRRGGLPELVVERCDRIRDLQFLPDGQSVAYAHQYLFGEAVLLTLRSRPEPVESWLVRRAKVTALALSADGLTAAVASSQYVRFGRLDAATVPPGYAARGEVQSLSLSPDGSRLAGTWKNCATVWETAGGREVRDFDGHAAAVEAVAYKPDGSLIASAGLDGRVLLWEPHGGAARAAYDWKLGPVHALAFSPDCLTLAVAGPGGLVLIDLE